MALARVVAFDGVDEQRIAEMKKNIEGGDRPDDLPASEIMILHDPDGQRSLAIVLFENEDDYRKGDATLSAMPREGVPGERRSVDKYQVAIRAKA